MLISSVLYLYTTPFDTPCTGNISEVEFCYQQGNAAGSLFTIVILEEARMEMGMGSSMTYRIIASRNVSADPGMDNCSLISTIHRCCTTRILEPVIQVSKNTV